MSITDATPAMKVDVATENPASYVDWSAILAGAALASAVSFVLLAFGSAIGLSLTSVHSNTGISMVGFAIAAALWLVWVQVSGFMAGGYLTGRLRRRHFDATETESDIRDGSHGLTVWAIGVLIGATVAFSGVTTAVSTATSAVSSVVSGSVSAASDAVGNLDDSLLVDRLFRVEPSATPTATPAGNADTSAEREEITRVFASSIASGELTDADRQYVTSAIAARTGLSPEEVQQRVDQAWTQVEELKASAAEAAERARRIAVVAAFITAASLLLGAVGAYYGAVMGGNHRDKQTVIPGWTRPW